MKKSRKHPPTIDKLFDDQKSDENQMNDAIDQILVDEPAFDELAVEFADPNNESIKKKRNRTKIKSD